MVKKSQSFDNVVSWYTKLTSIFPRYVSLWMRQLALKFLYFFESSRYSSTWLQRILKQFQPLQANESSANLFLNKDICVAEFWLIDWFLRLIKPYGVILFLDVMELRSFIFTLFCFASWVFFHIVLRCQVFLFNKDLTRTSNPNKVDMGVIAMKKYFTAPSVS